MALIQDSSKKKHHPRKSCFLGCFGFSVNNQEKLYSDDKVNSAGSKRKQSSCFSFIKRFQRKQSPVKTVPVDINGGAEKLNSTRQIHYFKKPYVKTATTVNESKVSATCQTVHLNKFTKSKYDKQQDIILDKSKKVDQVQHSSCQKGLSRSFTTANADNASNLIGSPQDKLEISRTISLPPPKCNKLQPVATNRDKVDGEKDMTFHNGNFDSFIGMSIVVVTLIIMLCWGKFCAIICTSTWFYFLPRFRAKNEPVMAEKNAHSFGNLDVDSKEYKKKVVLHGFLERNHRNSVGS